MNSQNPRRVRQLDGDDIEIVDISIVDDIEIIRDPEISVVAPEPGSTRTDDDGRDTAPGDGEQETLATVFGPEMIAGIVLTALFVVFAVVLGLAAAEPSDELDDGEPVVVEDAPVAPAAEEIEVEIGEPLVIERGE